MAFSDLNGTRFWTYVLTNDSIPITANMGLKFLSIKGKAGTGTIIGNQTVNNGVTTYASAAQDIVAGDILTYQELGGNFISGLTITAGLGVTVYLTGII